MTQCTAKSKQSGKRCKRPVTPGRTVCYIHGGKTPRGVASPNFKHGRYTKSLVGSLLSDYHAALDDPELLNLQEEIALVDSRIAAILKRTDKGESGALWKHARNTYKEMEAARLANDLAAEVAARVNLGLALDKGHLDYAVWNEIAALLESRRKLVESERRRMVDMRALVSTEDVMAAVKALVGAVRMYVKEPDTLRNIVDEIERALGRPTDRAADSGRVVTTISQYRAD